MSIKIKSILLSVVAPVFLILILSGVLLWVQFQADMNKERQSILAGARNIQSEIRLEISESFEILRNIALNPLTARVMERMNQIPEGLDNDDFQVLDEFSTIQELLGLSVEGTRTDLAYIASRGSGGIILGSNVQIGEGFDVRGRDYYQAAMGNPGTTVISSPRISAEESAEPIIVITAARSVENEQGRTVGIVAVNYRLNGIIEIIRENMEEYGVSITFFDSQSRSLLWNRTEDGTYFFDPDNVISLKEWVEGLGVDEIDTTTVAVANSNEFYLEGETFLGSSLIQTVSVGDTRWSLAVIQARSKVVGEVLGSLVTPIAVFVLIFIGAQMVVFLLYMRLMVNPMLRLGRRLEVLSRADADLTLKIQQGSNDEIGKVALNFNTFVEKLRYLMVEVKTVIERTSDIRSNIASNTEETTSAIEQINANLKSIDEQLALLDQEISDNATAIEQITQNISSMDEQIINQSAMVEESTSAITQMMASLNNVNNVAQTKRKTTQELAAVASEGKDIIEETSANFKMVVQQIDQIQEMASAINDIASQTNLLSMNAAIEAAHAGESGRGFAVVAEEIRKLAESAGQSSQTISQLIADITQSVQDTDEHVERTTVAFERISGEVNQTVEAFTEIEHSVAELNIGGQQILESSQQINEVTVNIKNGSTEITSGTEAMLASAGKIRDISGRVSTGMNESSSGAGEIVESMQMMVKLSHELSTIVDQLTENFSRFKTETGDGAGEGAQSAEEEIQPVENPISGADPGGEGR